MDRLWAPWRIRFVEKGDPVSGCIFCELPAEFGDEADRKNLVLGRTEHSFAILNKYPYTSGHVMVVPRRHTAVLESLSSDEMLDLSKLLQHTVAQLKATYRPDGINVGMNLGRAGGAGIVDHLHWHAVPRWTGDTNFMTVVGDTRVIVEDLDQTWQRLRPLFAPSI